MLPFPEAAGNTGRYGDARPASGKNRLPGSMKARAFPIDAQVGDTFADLGYDANPFVARHNRMAGVGAGSSQSLTSPAASDRRTRHFTQISSFQWFSQSL